MSKYLNILIDTSGSMAEDCKNAVIKYLLNAITSCDGLEVKNYYLVGNQCIKIEDIAGDTAGFTGAELANVLNEAAILATRNKHEQIEKIDLEDAVKKVTVGLEKHSRVISDKDKRLTAYHEAGHAIVSKYLGSQLDDTSFTSS